MSWLLIMRQIPRADFIAADAFVSLDTARRVSKKLGIPFEGRSLRYVIHAILHLSGYDDLTPAKKKLMWKKQEMYIKKYLDTKPPVSRNNLAVPCCLVTLPLRLT